MSLDVSGLSRFIQENADELLTNISLGAPILKSGLIRIETGVKDRRNLNFFQNTNVYLEGKDVSTPSGSTVLSQKYVEVQPYHIYTVDNISDFEQKYLSMNLPKGSQYGPEDYPSIIAKNIVDQTVRDIGITAWRGKRTVIAGNRMTATVQGWIYKLKSYYSAGTQTASTISPSSSYSAATFSISNAVGITKEVYNAMHGDVIGEQLYGFYPTAPFNDLKSALLADNAYAINFSSSDPNEFTHPVFGNLIIRRDPSMGNEKAIVITTKDNLIYQCDGESEEDALEIKPDPIIPNKIHKIQMFKLGFDVAFPEYAGIFTW